MNPMTPAEASRLPERLTPREASDILGFHQRTLRRWADRGRVPCIRSDGGHRRFHRDDVLKLLDALLKNGHNGHIGQFEN